MENECLLGVDCEIGRRRKARRKRGAGERKGERRLERESAGPEIVGLFDWEREGSSEISDCLQ